MIPSIPKSMANQSIILKKYIGRDGIYDEPQYETPMEIDNCVFQPQTIYSGTNNNRQVVANAVLYLYTGLSNPMPKLTKDNYESQIIFEGQTYTVKSIIDNRDPFSNDLWSYEIEVL